jgi:hypothetical protein
MAKHALIKEFDAFMDEFKVKAKVALKEEFKTFFEQNPEVHTIRWTQYAPYFNDGEPCEFSVHEPVFLSAPTDSEDEGGERDVLWAIQRETGSWSRSKHRFTTPREDDLLAACEKITSLLQGLPEDLMRSTFGTDVAVNATRDGITTEGHYHE